VKDAVQRFGIRYPVILDSDHGTWNAYGIVAERAALMGAKEISFNAKPTTVIKPAYLEGKWKNNPDNMELQSDTGRIVLIYYAKSVNIIAGTRQN
jgi:hypothetical protein